MDEDLIVKDPGVRRSRSLPVSELRVAEKRFALGHTETEGTSTANWFDTAVIKVPFQRVRHLRG